MKNTNLRIILMIRMTTNVFNLKSYLNLNLFQLITANRFIGKDNIDHIMFAGF